MDDKSKSGKHSGPITEAAVRSALKKQGIDDLDELIKQMVKQANAGGGSSGDLTAGGGKSLPGGGGQTELTIVYDSDKYGLILR